MQPSAIDVRDLRVVRGGREVLRGISLDVTAGKVTGLLGPSGSGKTTLLRALVGVQQAVSGELSLLGAPAGSPGLRSRVAYMTQSPSVYADLTVRENLRYFARVLGAAPAQIDAAIETVALGGHEEQTVVSLSGGERARVSLAIALLNEPELLALDEPTVGLDPVLRRDLWATFHTIAEGGSTLLVSSHVMDEADRCDELILLREGEVLATGTPAALRLQTGAEDLDQAFLDLIDRAEAPA